MPETAMPELRPALAGKALIARNGVTLEPMPEGTVLHLLAGPGGDQRILETAVAQAGLSLRPVSPRQWFAVGERRLPEETLKMLEAALGPHADIVDQSHGRVGIRVAGPMATRLLAKGTAVDLAPAAFPAGHAATTLIGHIAAHMTRTGAESFELLVLRGFADSLWHDLEAMSREFAP